MLCAAWLMPVSLFVAAAGNDGKNASGQKIYGQIHSPGNEPSVITVGASNTFGTDSRADDTITTYSSRGPTRSSWTDEQGVQHYDNLIKPDVSLPAITSSLPNPRATTSSKTLLS